MIKNCIITALVSLPAHVTKVDFHRAFHLPLIAFMYQQFEHHQLIHRLKLALEGELLIPHAVLAVSNLFCSYLLMNES